MKNREDAYAPGGERMSKKAIEMNKAPMSEKQKTKKTCAGALTQPPSGA
jgi:hypothetical protein